MNQKILEKAVQRAIDGGWKNEWDINYTESMGWTMVGKGKVKKADEGLTAKITYMLSENDIIFDHDFAKALWGETPPDEMLASVNGQIGTHFARDSWQYHLMKMVIANDPIKYLGDNI